MLNRIKEILLREGFNSGSFADEIGVQRSSLSHIINGRNNPSLDFILKVLQRFPKLNSEWLLMGKGEMYIFEEAEAKADESVAGLPDLFSKVNPEPVISENKPTIDQTPEIPVSEEIKFERAEKYVSQILIFYSDSTYQVYKPEKPGI